MRVRKKLTTEWFYCKRPHSKLVELSIVLLSEYSTFIFSQESRTSPLTSLERITKAIPVKRYTRALRPCMFCAAISAINYQQPKPTAR